MRNTLSKLFIFIIYLILLLLILNFDLHLLINIKMLGVIIIGTSLLAFLYGIKNGRRKIFANIKRNLLITGYLATFLAQVSVFSDKVKIENIYSNIVINFLPLFYAFIIYLIIDIFAEKPTKTKAIEHSEEDISMLLEDLGLTKRETSVAKELFKDISNKEIGENLYISENTVKKHTQNIFKKASVKNRTEFLILFKNPERENTSDSR